MKNCPYCQKEFSDKGLSLHIWKIHQKQVAAQKYFAEEGRRIEAQVHAEVEAKKREFALIEKRQKLSDELQSLANDIENEWKPLQNCSLCGNPWENHKSDCPFATKTSTLNEFIDFMTILMGGQQ